MPKERMVYQVVRRLYLSAKLTKKKLDLDWIELLLCGHPVQSNGISITRAFENLSRNLEFSTGSLESTEIFCHPIDAFKPFRHIGGTTPVLQLGYSTDHQLRWSELLPIESFVTSLYLRVLKSISKLSPIYRQLSLGDCATDRR